MIKKKITIRTRSEFSLAVHRATTHPRRMIFVRLFGRSLSRLGLMLWLATGSVVLATDTVPPATAGTFDFANPKIFTGTLYETGSNRKKILYQFRRTAVRTGDTVRVTREFTTTNGSPAAVENIVYESSRFVSYQMQEFQADVSGRIEIAPDSKNPAQSKLFISYGNGLNPPKGDAQNLPTDMVIDDTLYPFLLAHWEELMRGDTVKLHFISLERKRPFVFRLVKTGESTAAGRAEVQIKMESVNLLVGRLVNPLVFTVEKTGEHRVISYLGRTTPRISKGTTWKYLDAETVFDWN